MFSRYEQHNRHRDGRNNKADRTRHLWQPWVERAADYFDGEKRITRFSDAFNFNIVYYCIITVYTLYVPHETAKASRTPQLKIPRKLKNYKFPTCLTESKFLLNCCTYIHHIRCRMVRALYCCNR